MKIFSMNLAAYMVSVHMYFNFAQPLQSTKKQISRKLL